MDNQHREIKGYRELSKEEIDLRNEIKVQGIKLGELIELLRGLESTDKRYAYFIDWMEEDSKNNHTS